MSLSVQSMISSYKSNMNMLRKSRYNKENNHFKYRQFYRVAEEKGLLNFKTATKDELQQIRATIILQKKRQATIYIISFVVVALVVLALALVMNHNFNKAENRYYANLSSAQMKKEAEQHQQLLKTHAFFIENAQKFIKLNEWDKAILVLNDARKMLPNDFATNYLLAVSLVNECNSTRLDCAIAEQHLNHLIKSNPANIDLLNLRAGFLLQQGDSINAAKDFENIDFLSTGL
jgi:predicted Zn-dependent protease